MAEINFPIGDAAKTIGAQTSGVFSTPVLKDANQFSTAFIQNKPLLRTGLQQTCEKINEVVHINANTNKAYSAGTNLGNMAFNKGAKIVEKTFDGYK